jgi:transcription initiation factor TFIIIB Brf1 subunit/transcription initiation factor TFIIB
MAHQTVCDDCGVVLPIKVGDRGIEVKMTTPRKTGAPKWEDLCLECTLKRVKAIEEGLTATNT